MSIDSNTVTSSIPTVTSMELALAAYLQQPYTVRSNSTLNQKLGILTNQAIPQNTYPKPNYIVLGIGGHSFTTLDGDVVPTELQHQTIHPSLAKMIPLIARPVNNDITAGQRANYRLRVLETHGGQNYYVYYAKHVPEALAGVQSETITKTVNSDGVTVLTPVPFAFDPTDLTAPNMLEINGDNQVVTASNVYVSVSSLFSFGFTVDEINELLNAVAVTRGNQRKAVISEVALCSGLDTSITIQTTGPTSGSTVSVPFTEAYAVQINFFTATFVDFTKINETFTFTSEVGNAAPINIVTTN